MAEVDEIAQGFVQFRFDSAGLEGPPALQAPLPIIGVPTEYPHRRIFSNLNIHTGGYIRNLAAVRVISICQGWFQKTNQRGSVCPQHISLPFMAMGMDSRRICCIHPCPQASAGSKVLLSSLLQVQPLCRVSLCCQS